MVKYMFLLYRRPEDELPEPGTEEFERRRAEWGQPPAPWRALVGGGRGGHAPGGRPRGGRGRGAGRLRRGLGPVAGRGGAGQPARLADWHCAAQGARPVAAGTPPR